jgi:transcription antitermination factor NusG
MATCDIATTYPWYALKVRVRGELLIRKALELKDYQIFLPTYKETRQYSDRLKKIDVPLFPGYLFCRLDVNRRLPILTTPGVDYILGSNGEPEPVPESEIAAIAQVLNSGAIVGPWPFLKTGSRVRVEKGAFAGVEGIFVSERGADRLVLSVTMLQRSISVEIDRTWIKPL